MPKRGLIATGNYRYGFNGKEMDNEVQGNGNQYDYGFRIYNPRLGKFLSLDPLAKSYPWYTPYQFAGNTPIQAIDLDGKEPEGVVQKNSNGDMSFTKPAAHLLSLVSGVPSELIEKTKIVQKTIMGEPPYYDPNVGGGGITSDEKITYTENFFSKDPREFSFMYNNKPISTSHGDNSRSSVDHWLSISSHEVKHLEQSKQFSGKASYFGYMAWQYFKSFDNQLEGRFPIGTKLGERTHDGVAEESQAEKGRTVYKAFKEYVDKAYSPELLPGIFSATMSDEHKIQFIDNLWKEYQNVVNPQPASTTTAPASTSTPASTEGE